MSVPEGLSPCSSSRPPCPPRFPFCRILCRYSRPACGLPGRFRDAASTAHSQGRKSARRHRSPVDTGYIGYDRSKLISPRPLRRRPSVNSPALLDVSFWTRCGCRWGKMISSARIELLSTGNKRRCNLPPRTALSLLRLAGRGGIGAVAELSVRSKEMRLSWLSLCLG